MSHSTSRQDAFSCHLLAYISAPHIASSLFVKNTLRVASVFFLRVDFVCFLLVIFVWFTRLVSCLRNTSFWPQIRDLILLEFVSFRFVTILFDFRCESRELVLGFASQVMRMILLCLFAVDSSSQHPIPIPGGVVASLSPEVTGEEVLLSCVMRSNFAGRLELSVRRQEVQGLLSLLTI